MNKITIPTVPLFFRNPEDLGRKSSVGEKSSLEAAN